jgi:hypothetical protein
MLAFYPFEVSGALYALLAMLTGSVPSLTSVPISGSASVIAEQKMTEIGMKSARSLNRILSGFWRKCGGSIHDDPGRSESLRPPEELSLNGFGFFSGDPERDIDEPNPDARW